MGKLTPSMAIFNSELLNYQRVDQTSVILKTPSHMTIRFKPLNTQISVCSSISEQSCPCFWPTGRGVLEMNFIWYVKLSSLGNSCQHTAQFTERLSNGSCWFQCLIISKWCLTTFYVDQTYTSRYWIHWIHSPLLIASGNQDRCGQCHLWMIKHFKMMIFTH